MTVDAINFANLKPYDGKTTRSFELLLYQLMVNEHGHLGKFTPIDGKGGDGGIEFYLELENGEVWGWQCKFFEDEGRLNNSSRKTKIEDSLDRACKNYNQLTKWTLCLKTNLTQGLTDKNGKETKGEQDWFNDTLPLKIPAGKTVALGFCGEEEVLRLLAKPVNSGLRYFFFGSLEVNQEWFESRSQAAMEKNREKYDPELHTLSDYERSVISSALMSPDYKYLLNKLFLEIPESKTTIVAELDEFKHKGVNSNEEKAVKQMAVAYFEQFDPLVRAKHQWFDEVVDSLAQYDLERFNRLVTTENQNNAAMDYLNNLPEPLRDDSSSFLKRINELYRTIRKFFENYDRVTRNYFHATQKYLVYLGDAAAGKTHLACDIAHNRLIQKLPVIFLSADRFSGETNLNEALLKLLDIPPVYGIDELIATLEAYGSVIGAKVPIVIDGLNETTFERNFSPIWRNHLAAFVAKLQGCNNLMLIVTCRESYRGQVWTTSDRLYFNYLDGFGSSDVKEAVTKYFQKYRLRADLTFASLQRFEQPLFLRIFCEIKNPGYRNGLEVDVNIESDSNNDLFSRYFSMVNDRLLVNSTVLRPKEQFIQRSMAILAKYLWENNCREISIDDFYTLIDGTATYTKGQSKADLLIDEGLVLTRELRDQQEYVSITFEIIAGYIIAHYLLQLSDPDYLFPEGPFHQKVKQDCQPHPLYENILGEMALLMPQLQQRHLHDMYGQDEDVQIHFISVCALWQLQPQYVRQHDLELIEQQFTADDASRAHMIALFRMTLTDLSHPLNSTFLSQLLFSLSVRDRDLSWTENVRWNAYDIQRFLEELMEQYQTYSMPEVAVQRLHLVMNYVFWLLTSTNRRLRDTATKTLYTYGRQHPERLAQMTYQALACNDPYVWDRLLAALYGVVLANQQSTKDQAFQHDTLPDIARNLYRLVFADDAPHYTTHIVARDHAARIIQLGLRFNPGLANEINSNALCHPFHQSSKVTFPVMEGADRIFDGPVSMDFSNYTIGYIVKGGHSYSNPPDKITVRGQIFHRIYQLGWNKEDYGSVDGRIHEYDDYSRTKRKSVERYGKKYSWIAYMEVAGYRDDLGLLDRSDRDHHRIEADIDPTFPKPAPNCDDIIGDLLGDRSLGLVAWLQMNDTPPVAPHLEVSEEGQQWVLMDGYINQTDEQANRARFTFIRGLIAKKADFNKLWPHLSGQRLGGRWLPEIKQNFYTYAGELYLKNGGTWSNVDNLEFELSRKKKRVKKGEPGYLPNTRVVTKKGGFSIVTTEPASVWINDVVSDKFDVLLPVMEYTWSSDQLVRTAGHKTILSAEIAKALDLESEPQSFDLARADGSRATLYRERESDDKNNFRLAYLRKDLLDEYLKATDSMLLWGIWGEKEPHLNGFEYEAFRTANGIDGFFEFQEVLNYQS